MNNFSHNLAHKPVLIREVLNYLKPVNGETYVDCTFGAGGYSRAILASADCNLYAIDCDPTVDIYAKEISKQYNNFKILYGRFSNIKQILLDEELNKVDAIILDLGVSSMQLDQPHRGFSFSNDAKLDMRMHQEGRSAWDIINNSTEEELADIIYYLGDETYARRIARKICLERIKNPIDTTLQLSKIIKSSKPFQKGKIDPATKTFQAIRIYVNNELEELKSILNVAEDILNIGGRLIIVSFHSLEDKIFKDFINLKLNKNIGVSRYLPIIDNVVVEPNFVNLTKNGIKPSDDEIKDNPRSRSARLRAIQKIGEYNDKTS